MSGPSVCKMSSQVPLTACQKQRHPVLERSTAQEELDEGLSKHAVVATNAAKTCDSLKPLRLEIDL